MNRSYMISDVEDYFTKGCGRCPRFATADCSTRLWAEELAELRRLCLGEGLEETVKWGHPCYMHAGRNIAIIGAFRGDFRLSFFEAALLNDPDGALERQGPNTATPNMIRFDGVGRVRALAPAIRAFLREAMGHAEAGRRAPKPERDFALPDELTEALDADPELAEAFHALTPGRRKSWALHIGQAIKPPTRVARIIRARARILAGKGATER